jgi:hypothetical protein
VTTLKSQGENLLDTAKAFVPGHITGIFRIHDEHDYCENGGPHKTRGVSRV